MGWAIPSRNLSRSARLNSRYPLAGFRCIGMSPRADHLRTVFCDTPRISAASAIFT